MEINLLNTVYFENSTEHIFSNSSSFLSENELSNNKSHSYGYLVYCVEKWPHVHSRIIFSCVSLLIQYILPILIVAITYGQIWWKLKLHRKKLRAYTERKICKVNTDSKLIETVETKKIDNTNDEHRRNSRQLLRVTTKLKPNMDDVRQHKMNVLLAFIAIIFAASWLPLNIFNILSDSKSSFMKINYGFYLINTICVLFAMSSAVSNPFLYGFLNENFKREYVKLFNQLKIRCFSVKSENI